MNLFSLFAALLRDNFLISYFLIYSRHPRIVGLSSGKAVMETIGEARLADLIPLQGPFQMQGETPSLESFLVKTSKLLCLEATTDEEGGSIWIRQKGSFEWLKFYKDAYEAGGIKCKSMVDLRMILDSIIHLVLRNGVLQDTVEEEILSVHSGELASAIVMVLTIRDNLRVCGKYVRWCKPEFRRKDAFEVEKPMRITAGVDVDVSSSIRHVESVEHRETRLSVRIASGTRLNLFRPLLVSQVDQKPLICGGKAKPYNLDSERLDEFHSEWNVCYSTASDPPKYWTSERGFYLH